jgi:hypothetical protein
MVFTIKNLLVCVGIFYLSRWLALPLDFGFGELTQGIIYHDDFEGTIVASLVLSVPTRRRCLTTEDFRQLLRCFRELLVSSAE